MSILWVSFKNIEDQCFHLCLNKVIECQMAIEIGQQLSLCAVLWLTRNAR